MNKQSIKNWAVDDRPREKLALKGAETLSNSELLAILINNGSVEKSAVDLAKELLAAVENNLQRLSKLSVKELVNLKIKGLGPAKAITIAAALELGVRRSMADNKKEVIQSSKDIANYLKAQLEYKKHEVFAVVFLNRANKINHYEIISEGGITGTVADPRIILKKALEHDAVSIVLCHNHPSGNLKPSRQDQELTNKIKEASGFFDIKVLDHIIVSEEGYYSFADDGML
ncbi:MAG TPA: DNA repair protein RadC [Segetibacter sp.]|nr:DNA repair protein RadC [Segetibacter sp.]